MAESLSWLSAETTDLPVGSTREVVLGTTADTGVTWTATNCTTVPEGGGTVEAALPLTIAITPTAAGLVSIEIDPVPEYDAPSPNPLEFTAVADSTTGGWRLLTIPLP